MSESLARLEAAKLTLVTESSLSAEQRRRAGIYLLERVMRRMVTTHFFCTKRMKWDTEDDKQAALLIEKLRDELRDK